MQVGNKFIALSLFGHMEIWTRMMSDFAWLQEIDKIGPNVFIAEKICDDWELWVASGKAELYIFKGCDKIGLIHLQEANSIVTAIEYSEEEESILCGTSTGRVFKHSIKSYL